VLFDVVVWLPFVTFGAVMLAWTVALMLAFCVRAKQVAAAAAVPDGGGGTRGLRLYARHVSYISAELAMASRKDGGAGDGGGGDGGVLAHRETSDARRSTDCFMIVV
jgi:hypothetical protein